MSGDELPVQLFISAMPYKTALVRIDQGRFAPFIPTTGSPIFLKKKGYLFFNPTFSCRENW